MIVPGRYHIRLANGRSLEAESSQFRDNGAKVQIWLLYRALNQVWDVSSAGNGQFFIRNVGGDKALDAHAPTVDNNGCKVQLWQAHDQNPNQKWIFQPVGRGYTIRCAGSNGTKVLDVKDRAIDRGGSPIQLWDAHNGDNQVWFLEPSFDRAIVSENFVDLRPNQTPIKHQGSRGSCTFFGRLAAIEAAYKKRGYGDLNLSEEFASILIKVMGLHSNWNDIRHENFRENQFAGTQGSSGLDWFTAGFRVPLESDVPYRSDDYTANANWATESQDETNQFNNTQMTRQVLSSRVYYGANAHVELGDGERNSPLVYERLLRMGYEVSVEENGHNMLVVGYDKRNPDQKQFIVKNSYGPLGSTNPNDYLILPYSYIDPANQAEYVTDVAAPGPFPAIAFLGRWNVTFRDGSGELTIYHVPGLGGLEARVLRETGRQIRDRRLGTLKLNGVMHRVNGSIKGDTIHLYFDRNNKNLHWETLSGRHLVYTLDRANNRMSGYELLGNGARIPMADIVR